MMSEEAPQAAAPAEAAPAPEPAPEPAPIPASPPPAAAEPVAEAPEIDERPRITPGPTTATGERMPQMIERTRRRGRRRRAPVFTPKEVKTIDYKDVDKLRKLISDRGKIDPRRKTGLTAKDQRKLAREIKRARHVALLPYTAEHQRQTSRFRTATRMAQRIERGDVELAPAAPADEQPPASAEQPDTAPPAAAPTAPPPAPAASEQAAPAPAPAAVEPAPVPPPAAEAAPPDETGG